MLADPKLQAAGIESLQEDYGLTVKWCWSANLSLASDAVEAVKLAIAAAKRLLRVARDAKLFEDGETAWEVEDRAGAIQENLEAIWETYLMNSED
jgi:hypothetical protein